MPDHQELLDLAINAAREAGKTLRDSTDLREVDRKSAKDVKLQADYESETLIRRMLREGAAIPIVGEEQGGDTSLMEKDELYWVVDPLDGTFNYLRELPYFCVSIGLMRGLEPVLGVVLDFVRDELFSAIVGEGFQINGQPHTSNYADDIDQAILLTGFPSGRDYSEASLRETVSAIIRFAKVRMMGAAALHLAHVAAGRADVYTEDGIKLWDIAAGMALVKAAGGHLWLQRVDDPERPFTFDFWAAGKKEWLPNKGSVTPTSERSDEKP